MNIRNILASLCAVMLLSACEAGPSGDFKPDMTFDNMKPLELNVSSVTVENRYVPPMKPPYIEHTFPTPPYNAVENLVKKKLLATGGLNAMRVIVTDASVVEEDLPVTCGVEGAFKEEAMIRLRAQIDLRLEVYNPASPQSVIGFATLAAKRTKSIMEDASPAERERSYYELTEAMMADINSGIRNVVTDKLKITPNIP